jgi:flagellar hook assembly protein FlgD
MDSVDVKLENFAYGLPFKVYLNQNYPNPFNDRTRISFQVTGYGGEEYLEVKIYSLLGREIATLFGDFMKAGEYSLYWNARNSKGIPVPSGSYVYSVIFNGKRISRKMTVLR